VECPVDNNRQCKKKYSFIKTSELNLLGATYPVKTGKSICDMSRAMKPVIDRAEAVSTDRRQLSRLAGRLANVVFL